MAQRRARLYEVVFDAVLKEEPIYANEITDYTIEKGSNPSDHIRNKPIGLTITGVCAGPGASQKIEKLRKYWQEKTLMMYTGRNIFRNMVIESLPTIHDAKNGDGFEFTIQLKQVKISFSKEVPYSKPDPVSKKNTKPQTKKTDKKGQTQPKKKTSPSNSNQQTLKNLGIDNKYIK